MTIALVLLIVSAALLFLFVYLKIPALCNLPQKEKKEAFPVIKEKVFVAARKTRKAFSLHNILRKILFCIRKFSSKSEEIITGWIRKLRR